MNISERSKIIIAAILMPTFFGFSFLASKVALNAIDSTPIALIAYRFFFAAIIMYILRKTKLINVELKGKDIRLILLLSIFYPVSSFIFETIGINMITSSESGIIISLHPIFTTIMATFILKEYPSKPQIGFILLSTAGVFFINYMQKEAGYDIIGYLILLLAVVLSSSHGALSRKASLDFKPEEITYMMIISGAVVFSVILILIHLIEGNIMELFTPLLNIKFMISVLYLAVGCSVISFFLLNYLYSKLEASRISVLTNIATVISIFAGVIILKEIIYWYHYVGAMAIISGTLGANYFGEKLNSFNK